MTAPLAQYFANQGLSGLGGQYDDDEDELGFPPALLAIPALAAFIRSRRRRGRRRRGLRGFDDDLMGIDDDLLGDDDTDDLDDAELDMDDAEVEELGGDDDEDEGELGGIPRVQRRIGKLQDKIMQLESKLASTPARKRRKRKRILKAIARAKHKIRKKESKIEKKTNIIAAKMGVPAAAIAAGALAAGGAGAALGVSAARAGQIEGQMARAQAEAAIGGAGVFSTTPYEGRQIRLPFTDTTTGSNVVRITVAAGAGLRTAAINMITPIISFASFEVVGIDTDLRVQQGVGGGGFPLNEVLVNLLLATVTVAGGINLLYATENVAFGAQTVNGQLSCSRTIPGIRDNPKLDRTNTATLAATFRQEITTTVAIEASFQAALVVRTLYDPQALRSV